MCKVVPGSQIRTIFDLQNLVTYQLLSTPQGFNAVSLSNQICDECRESFYSPSKEEVWLAVRDTIDIFVKSGYLRQSDDNRNYIPYRRKTAAGLTV